MSVIWAIIAGLVVGLIARAVLPGKQNIPIWLTIVIGIVGALIGNALASALGVRHTGGIDWIRHRAADPRRGRPDRRGGAGLEPAPGPRLARARGSAQGARRESRAPWPHRPRAQSSAP